MERESIEEMLNRMAESDPADSTEQPPSCQGTDGQATFQFSLRQYDRHDRSRVVADYIGYLGSPYIDIFEGPAGNVRENLTWLVRRHR
jgi:hypothetical protein